MPWMPIAEDVYENELSTWYVDPFLSELFGSPDEGTFLPSESVQKILRRKPQLNAHARAVDFIGDIVNEIVDQLCKDTTTTTTND
ncbi:hypothetical protein CU097_007711 [Rhizopus azygosporus]|uniref:Uncharacterized protein n=1 Tax=Rhizopus azygosporus TaxID=86630 RepID=A0A367J3L3_RHIAZ|nr:hypothetical protein CU097_007711 [Rhizopus azygosporus]